MGFDLTGVQPSGMTIPRPLDWSNDSECREYCALLENIDGAYFRNNVWWWRPLWQLVCSVCDDILTEDDMDSGTFNNGHLIQSDKATKMGNRLWKLLDNGSITKLIKVREDRLDELPDEECNCCNGKGVRKGWEGWKSESEWLKTHDSLVPSDDTSIPSVQNMSYEHAHMCKGCNACHGKGVTAHFEKSYPLDKDNVREFATFCLKSGGYTIA